MQRRPAARLSDSAKHCSDLCRNAPRFLMHRVGAVHMLYIKNVADVVLRFAVDGPSICFELNFSLRCFLEESGSYADTEL